MTERITCDCINRCRSQIKPMELNVNDSLKIRYQFRNLNNKDELIPLDLFNLTITYYIKDREETYIASKINRTTTNCILYPKQSIIKVIFENHGLKSGKLYADFKFTYYDPEFNSKEAVSNITKFTNIILVD